MQTTGHTLPRYGSVLLADIMSVVLLGNGAGTILHHWRGLTAEVPRIPIPAVQLGATLVSELPMGHLSLTCSQFQVSWVVCNVAGMNLGFNEARFGVIYAEHGNILRTLATREQTAQLYADLENRWFNHRGVFWNQYELYGGMQDV